MKVLKFIVSATLSLTCFSPCFAHSINDVTAVTLLPMINPADLYKIGVDCGHNNDFKDCNISKIVIRAKAMTDQQQRVITIKTNMFSPHPDQPICEIYSHDGLTSDSNGYFYGYEIVESVKAFPGYDCRLYNSANEQTGLVLITAQAEQK